MVTHPTRTPPPKVYFISLLASSASPHCLVQMGALWGEAPWRKTKKKLRENQKKQKNKKTKKTKKNKKKQKKTKKTKKNNNKIWGFFGERPHGENQKKNLEKTKKNKQKTIFGDSLGGGPMEKIKTNLEKTKKNKKTKKTIFGDSLGRGPREKTQKKQKNLEKTKKNKKNKKHKKKQYLGTLGWTPLSTKTSGKLFFFLVFLFSRVFFWFSNFLIPKTSGKLYFSFPWHMSILAGICDIWVICSIFASLFDLPAHLAKPIASLAPAPELSATQRQSCFTYFASSVYPLWVLFFLGVTHQPWTVSTTRTLWSILGPKNNVILFKV